MLAEHEDRLWLVAVDGSWGPGTIAADAVTEHEEHPEWYNSRTEERGQVSVTWNHHANAFHVYCVKPNGQRARADLKPQEAGSLAVFLLRHGGEP